jgi:hypothetical protein
VLPNTASAPEFAILPAELAGDIDRFLAALGVVQEELTEVYRAKRESIREARLADINRLTEREATLVLQLQAHLRGRHQILQRAKPLGRFDSIESLVRSLDVPERDRLLQMVGQTRQTADVNRRESWILWIVSQQSLRFFRDVLDLMANGGKKAPVYSARSESDRSFHSVILDASA